ncbi:hypothetical protein JCM18899A_13170 [Nocardioides sp. AN3]
MADIYHWRRHHPTPRGDGLPKHATLRAMVGGVTAIVLLTALLAGIIGAVVYAVVFGLLKLVGH